MPFIEIQLLCLEVSTLRGVCNFLGSVSLQQKSEAMARSLLEPRVISSNRPVLQLRVPAQFYLENKGKCILEA